MGDRQQWQFPKNEADKVIGWRSNGKGLENKGPFATPDDIAGKQDADPNLDTLSSGTTTLGTTGLALLGDETVDDAWTTLGNVTRARLVTVLSRPIPLNIQEFGAFGNDNEASLTDETTEIQAAIDAAIAQGRELFIPGTNYQCGLVNVTSAFKLYVQGDPQNRPIFHGTQALSDTSSSEIFKFVRSGYDVDSGVITLSADILPYGKTLPVNTTAGLEEGMLIELCSDAFWHYDHRDTYTKGEIHLITRVISGTEIEIYDRVRDFYDISVETVTIRAWHPERFVMNHVGFKMPAPSPSVGNTCLEVDRAINPEYNDIRVEGSTFTGIMNTRSWAARYYNPELYRIGRYLGGTSSAGYGIADRATVGTIIRGLKSHAMRRAVDFHTLVGSAPARDWVVEDFNVNGGGTTVEGDEWYPEGASPNYGLGMHVCEDGEFRNGTIADVETGINNRSRNIDVKNVKFRGRMIQCLHYSYGTGSIIDGCSYMREDWPDKMASGSLDIANMPTEFIRLSSSAAESVWQYDSPLVITNNVAFGLRESFVNFGANAIVLVENSVIKDNVANIRTAVGETFAFYKTHLGNAGRMVSSVIGPNTLVDLGAGTAVMYESDLSSNLGYIASGGIDGAVEVGPREYVVVLGDDTSFRIRNAAINAGDRVMVWITGSGGEINSIFTIAAASTTTDAIGTLDTDIAANATGVLTGTTGTDTKLNVSLTSGGDLYIENRLGIGRRLHVKIL